MSPSPSRMQTLVIVGILLATVVPLVILITRQPSGEVIWIEPPAPTPTPHALRVYVSGAVERPDVYVLPPDSIAKDAVLAAGGLTGEANDALINLAQRLRDGDHLYVPRRGEPVRVPLLSPVVPRPEASPTSRAASGGVTPGTAGGLVDINTATSEELDRLPHIGPALATSIVEYREKNGPFRSIQEILNVPRIGPSIFQDIKDLICTCTLDGTP